MLHNLARSHCFNIPSFFESQIHKKYVWEQLTIHLVESYTKGHHPQQKSSSLLMAKHHSGGNHVPHSGPAKWRIPRRRRYFSTVPRRKNTRLVQLHSAVLVLPPRPDWLLCAHIWTTPAALKQNTPNGVSHVVGQFMTYSYLRQKLKNDHSYWTSGCWRYGWRWSVFPSSKLMDLINTHLEFPSQLPNFYPSPRMWRHHASRPLASIASCDVHTSFGVYWL